MNFTHKPMKHKIGVPQKLRDKFILKLLCLHSVLFWIALHLLYLVLQLHYLFDISKWGSYLNEFPDIFLNQSDKACSP